MKKILSTALLFIACICLYSCSSNSSTSSGIDYTIDVESINTNANIIAEASSSIPDFGHLYTTPDELCQIAPIILQGEILQVHYSDSDGRPSTIYDFCINSVLRGNFNQNDIISIEEFGGYIRGNIFAELYGDSKFPEPLTEDDLIHYCMIGNAPEPQVGDEYVLFLAESDIIEGAYSIFGVFTGKFFVDGNNLYRYEPEGENLYSTNSDSIATHSADSSQQNQLSELIDAVENAPFDSDLFEERYGN